MNKKTVLIWLLLLLLVFSSCKGDGFDSTKSETPYLLSFSSVQEMRDFMICSIESPERYNEFVGVHSANQTDSMSMITQQRAKQISSDFLSHSIVIPIDISQKAESSSINYTFNSSYKVLRVGYSIENVNYSFEYRFDKEFDDYKMKGKPVLNGLEIGSYTVDLYRKEENAYHGVFMAEGFPIYVQIKTEQIEKISLKDFDLVAL